MWDPFAEFERVILGNGLTVHVSHWKGRPWEYMGFVVHAGSKLDPPGREGLAHFVEHAVSENASVPHKDIRQFFEGCGGNVNLGATGWFDTHYDFALPIEGDHLRGGLQLMGEMLIRAKLVKQIERERQVIIGEFRDHYPRPHVYELEHRESLAIYPGYWLEGRVCGLGDMASIAAITASDLQAHYDQHYTPDNISVVAVGGLRMAEVLERLEQSPFADHKPGERCKLPDPLATVPTPRETRYVCEESKYKKEPADHGAYRTVGLVPGTWHKASLSLLCDMLGEVLYEEIREQRSWSYGVHCGHTYMQDLSLFTIDCEGLALEALDRIEQVVDDLIQRMGESEPLFEEMRHRRTVSRVMADFKASEVFEGAVHDLGFRHRIVSLEETGRNWRQASMDDIKRLVEHLTAERRYTLITKP